MSRTSSAPAARPDLRLLVPAMAAWAVSAVTLGLPATARVVAAVALGVLAVVGTARGRRERYRAQHARYRPGPALQAVLLTVTACALTLSASGLHGWRRAAGTVPALAEQRATVRLVARVASDPRLVGPRTAAGSAATRDAGRTPLLLVRLQVRSVDGRGQRSRVDARVLALADPSWGRLRFGEVVQARGRLAPAGPGDDVVATVAIRGPPRVLRPAPAVLAGAERLRTGLRVASSGLPPDARGLLPGLVVGDTSQQPADLTEAMRLTGLTHLSAVSGTNTTMVCVLALGLGRSVGLGRRLRLLAAAVVLTGFVLLARPEPSVLRAAVMGALGLLALGTARGRAALPALSATVVTLLVLDPWLARSYGFALSVLATCGLLLLGRRWTDQLARRLPRPLAAAVAVPLAAQVLCGPVVVLLSGQVSLVSLPANMIAAPCVLPATVLGLGAVLCQPVAGSLATALAWVAAGPCLVITGTARWLAQVPGGQVAWPGGAVGASSLAALTVALVVVAPALLRRLRPDAGSRPVTLGTLAVAGLGVAALAAPVPGTQHWPPEGWSVVACDVGQGDAVVLTTGPGRAVLVDVGPEPAAVDRCLRELAVRTLDAVVLTHFHADHVGGLPGALRRRRTAVLVVTALDEPPAQARRVRTVAAAAGVPVRTVVDGERLQHGPLRAEVVWPARIIRDGSVPNNASIVLSVHVRGVRALLLGDVEPAAARVVAARLRHHPGGPGFDVLKVAHHGSALQDPGLVRQTRARVGLISVGADNGYGHPAPSLLRLLAGAGTLVARTDRHGDLAVVGTAGRLRLVTSGPHPTAVGRRR